VKTVLPATDPRGDVDNGNSGVQNAEMLLNHRLHSRVRDSERVDDDGDEGAATFAGKSLK